VQRSGVLAMPASERGQGEVGLGLSLHAGVGWCCSGGVGLRWG
jgi:hypothetical protein